MKLKTTLSRMTVVSKYTTEYFVSFFYSFNKDKLKHYVPFLVIKFQSSNMNLKQRFILQKLLTL